MAAIPVPAVIGFYDDPDDLLYVAEKARTQHGFKSMDAYTPFPVHGIEEALDLPKSQTITVARLALLTGWFLGFSFQSWTSSVDWAVNIGGKPFISWPAWIPVTFEFGVLMAGFANLLSLFAFCGLYPKPKTAILSKRITNDRFVLVIPAKDAAEEARAVRFLEAHKALKIKVADSLDKKNARVVFRAPAILEQEGAHA